MSKEIIQHPYFGAISVIRSGRSRRISVSIRPPEELRLSLPDGVKLSEGLGFMETKRQWIDLTMKRLKLSSPAPHPTTRGEIEVLRAEAKRRLPDMCSRLSAQTGLKYRSITVRASRTRWGSCSASNDISLSLFLMRLPDELIEYVIMHELCHVKYKDHSQRFHAMLNSLLGGREKQLRGEIRRYRPQ